MSTRDQMDSKMPVENEAAASGQSGPLGGVRIVDLTSMILGPMATQYLGDLGADVIKVEAPVGDLTRYIGPQRHQAMAAFYLNSNRNKRSIVLDVKTKEGQAILARLLEGADVLLHSIRTPSARKLGLGYDQLCERFPRLVVCHAQGYSERGVYAGMPAYDDVIQAASGLAMLQAVVAGEPRFVPSVIADKVSAVHAAYAVLAALLQRGVTGRGQDVVISMMEAMVSFNTVEHLWGAAFEPPLAPMGYVPVSQASRRPFATRDGHICVLPYTDEHWARFCGVVGDEALTNDERYRTHGARQTDLAGFYAEIGRRVAQRSTDEWVEVLTAADVPFSRVNTLQQLLDEPHLKSSGFWRLMEHPSEGTIRYPSPFMEIASMDERVPRHAPGLGEHTREVLAELGLADAEIDALYASGVVRAQPRPMTPKPASAS